MSDLNKIMDEIAYVCQITVGKPIGKDSYDTPLAEYGLDSLDYMDLMYNLEERFDTKFKLDARKIASLTVANLANRISELQSEQVRH